MAQHKLKSVAGVVAAGVAYMRYKKNRAENQALQEKTMDFRRQQEANRNMRNANDNETRRANVEQRMDVEREKNANKNDLDRQVHNDGAPLREQQTRQAQYNADILQHKSTHMDQHLANETTKVNASHMNAMSRANSTSSSAWDDDDE